MSRRAFIQSLAAAALVATTGRNPSPAEATSSASVGQLAVYRIPGSIRSDGSREVSQQINDWIASVPDGSSQSFMSLDFGGGSFWCDNPITLTDRTGLQLLNGTFQRKTNSPLRAQAHFRLTRCSYVQLDQLIVVGVADPLSGYVASLEAQHGFDILSCSNISIDSCAASNVWGDQIELSSSDSGLTWCDTVRITNFAGGYSHRQGLTVAAARNVYCESNIWGKVARTGVDFEPNGTSWGVQNFTSVYDWFRRHGLNWIGMGGGYGGDVTNVTFRGAYVTANSNIQTLVPSLAMMPSRGRRADLTFDHCTGQGICGTMSGGVFTLHDVSGTITVTNCSNPLEPGLTPPMHMVRYTGDASLVAYGNTPDLVA